MNDTTRRRVRESTARARQQVRAAGEVLLIGAVLLGALPVLAFAAASGRVEGSELFVDDDAA